MPQMFPIYFAPLFIVVLATAVLVMLSMYWMPINSGSTILSFTSFKESEVIKHLLKW